MITRAETRKLRAGRALAARVTRRAALQGAIAAAFGLALRPRRGWARRGVGAISTSKSGNYLGVNLSGLKYYAAEQPFLNVFKQAGANGTSDGSLSGLWFASGFNYNPNLLLDADGNVTSMKDSTGALQTQIFAVANYNLNGGTLPPNATSLYPTGIYRMVFSGPGTLFVQGDLSIRSADNPSLPAGLTLSGNSVISTLAMGTSATIYVYVGTATASGMQFGVSSLPNDGVNYIKFISLVQSSLAASYDAGQIFHPNFLAQLSPYSRLRFMDWHATNLQSFAVNFDADLPSGGTSGNLCQCKFQGYIAGTTLTITSWDVGQYSEAVGMTIQGPGVTAGTTLSSGGGNSWQVNNSQTVGSSGSPVTMYITKTWAGPSGAYTFVFSTGQAISDVTCTYGSSAVTWTTPLSGVVSSSGANVYGGMAFFVKFPTWASRPKMSNFSWTGQAGVPYEVQALLCNQLGVDGWFNVPLECDYCDSTYASSLAALLRDGTGASISGPIGAFPGLNSAQKAYIEGSNEVWNLGTFGKSQAGFALMLGVPLFMGKAAGYNEYYATQEWYGTRVAGIADAFYAAYGSTAFSSRVVVSMGAQCVTGTGEGYLKAAMNTPDWTSAAYTHHIGAVHYAPYMQLLYGISQADMATISALADPVGEIFSLAYSNKGVSGNTYPSLNSGGYVRNSSGINAFSTIVTDLRANGYAWANITVLAYEMGEDTVTTTAGGIGSWLTSAELTVLKDTYRDTRMQYLYYDPGHVLSTNPGYLVDLMNAGLQSGNIFNDCDAPNQSSTWAQYGDQGQLESVMQTISPVSSAPGKWQGCYNFAKAA